MATNYPGSADTFATISGEEMGDEVGGRNHEDFHNDANDAIEAIEGELGATPSGASATVAARLDGIEADATAAEGDASANAEAIAGKANGTALSLPGTDGNYASTPYTVANTVTGDLDIRWVGALDDWGKAASV